MLLQRHKKKRAKKASNEVKQENDVVNTKTKSTSKAPKKPKKSE